MTRKRFVKILLSLGVGKREAERLAVMQRKYCGQYYDIRQDWNTWWNMFHLEICVTEEVQNDIQRKESLAVALSDQPETGKGAGR